MPDKNRNTSDVDEPVTGTANEEIRGVADDDDAEFEETDDLDDDEDEEESTTF
jgi:hypothetical protein